MANSNKIRVVKIELLAVVSSLLLFISWDHIQRLRVGIRRLSVNLGGGKCKWTPPNYNIPGKDEKTYHKTLIAGFPSGDKRLTFVQMEALTGLPAKDEWDFEFLGDSNHPFIKANYPHHEGIWGWGRNADQVVMVVRNIRRSMVEYHDILWDIGYAKTWDQANEFLTNLYRERPPLEDFLDWRDERVHDEIHWYGWFIDYYMEGGLMRDMFTHKITTPEHWNMLMVPTAYSKAELEYNLFVSPEEEPTLQPSYDPHCLYDVSGGCEPILVVSAEKLVDHTTGPAESAKLAQILENKLGIDVIEEEARECIWRELIVNKKGLKTFIDRPGIEESDYSFTEDMLVDMVIELDRLITKYGSPPWNLKQTAQDLVTLLTEHRTLIQEELDEVRAGVRHVDY